jgi:hypothetical protein
MKFIKNFILILLFILPISNVFANVTHIDQQTFDDGGTGSSFLNGIEFNSDGTKRFTIYSNTDTFNCKIDYINEYDL